MVGNYPLTNCWDRVLYLPSDDWFDLELGPGGGGALLGGGGALLTDGAFLFGGGGGLVFGASSRLGGGGGALNLGLIEMNL